ncbi:hypothetical protein [Sphingobacterium sp.]|uniref:hypothetical protein n=1 Tax=Sphingobacterium sp. TaxID=341027 RepID=UPI0031D75415
MNLECFIDVTTVDVTIPYIILGKEMSVICNLIEHEYFRKIKIGSTGLRIYLIEPTQQEKIDRPIKGIYPLVNYYKQFDFQEYLQLKDNDSKKALTVKMLKEAVLKIGNEMDWNIDVLLDAFAEVDKLNYHFVHLTNKKRFKGVKRQMQVETIVEPGFLHYNLLVYEKDTLMSRHHIVTLNAFYNLFFEANRVVSEAKWEDANTFVVSGKKGELERIRFEYKLDEDKLTRKFVLEHAIVEEFMEEFDLATTMDEQKIEMVLRNRDTSKWHIYI